MTETWPDISLGHKSYTSYPIIYYVNPFLLWIQGQLRGVMADMWNPAGSDVSSADVWLNHPQASEAVCKIQPDWPQSWLSPYLPPQGHARTHTYIHTRTQRAYFNLCVFFCFYCELFLLHSIFRLCSHPIVLQAQQWKELHLLVEEMIRKSNRWQQRVKEGIKARGWAK